MSPKSSRATLTRAREDLGLFLRTTHFTVSRFSDGTLYTQPHVQRQSPTIKKRTRAIRKRSQPGSLSTMTRTRIVLILILGFGCFAGAPALGTDPSPEAQINSPTASDTDAAREILRAAFANRYEVNLTTQIELTVHSRSGQQRKRTLQAVTKVIDHRVHSLGRLTSPEHLRGMTVMMMEAEDRSHDAFIYMPSLDKVRRINSSQRGDAFFGSDVTYEDIEHQTVADYTFLKFTKETRDGEPVFRIHASPKRRLNYDRVIFTIAQTDGAILGAEYFKRDTDAPYRVLSAPRSHMIVSGGHVLPTRMKVENRIKGSHTEVTLYNLRTDEKIDDRIFSVRTLESRRDLPGKEKYPEDEPFEHTYP